MSTKLSWDMINPDTRKTTLNQRNSQLKTLGKLLNKMGLDIENPEIYKNLDIEEFAKLIEHYAQGTRAAFYGMLRALTNYYSGSSSLFVKLTEMHDKSLENYKTKVVAFSDDNYRNILKEKTVDDTPRNMKILSIISLSPLSGIRVGELMRVTLVDDGEHSFWDLKTGKCYMRSPYTKNGRDREFDIDKDTAEQIRKVVVGKWLLSQRNLSPYSNASFLLATFKETYGFRYGRVRKTAVQNAHDEDDMDVTNKHANIMGHKIQTAHKRYVANHRKYKPLIIKKTHPKPKPLIIQRKQPLL